MLATLVATSGLALGARRCATPRMVNSDSRPTQEYMDFLMGKGPEQETEDCGSIIVGDGRVGSMLYEFGQRKGLDDILVKRMDRIPELEAGGQLVRKPIYVCTRNDDLESILGMCPDARKEDLVFLQNGQLEPFKQKHGLYANTQACLWFAAMRKGAKPLDGITSDGDGLTTASGKWAGSLARRLETGGLTCNVVGDRDLRRNMLEKLIWISSFMLVGAVHGGITVGEVEEKHKDEVVDIILELASFCRFTLAVSLKVDLEERLCEYARRVEFFPTALKEFEWRNGYFYRYSLMAGKRKNAAGLEYEMPDSTPIHTEYLMLAKEKGLISSAELESVRPSFV